MVSVQMAHGWLAVGSSPAALPRFSYVVIPVLPAGGGFALGYFVRKSPHSARLQLASTTQSYNGTTHVRILSFLLITGEAESLGRFERCDAAMAEGWRCMAGSCWLRTTRPSPAFEGAEELSLVSCLYSLCIGAIYLAGHESIRATPRSWHIRDLDCSLARPYRTLYP